MAQEGDLQYQVVDVRGRADIYRDETDETSRLHKGQKVNDEDSITTETKSEVVLRLKGKAYLHISQNTKVHITRLQWSEGKGVQCKIHLNKGRVLIQMDKAANPSFEVLAGKILCRGHGKIFEVYKKKDEVRVTAFEGSVVTNSHGHVEMAKTHQVMKYDSAKFRYKHYLKAEDEGRLEEWTNHLGDIREKHPPTKR